MRHTVPTISQFYVTAPQPCPYLASKTERKLFTAVYGESAQKINDTLSKQGFRRSQNVLYRPACTECSACMSARIKVADFRPSKTQRRILNAIKKLKVTRSITSPWATEYQFDLFSSYLDARHASGGMVDMDVFEFAAMVEETPIKSRMIEYNLSKNDKKGSHPLIAASLTDVLDDGLSMVYSFYNPNMPKLSLGSYMILDHINIAKESGLPYVYLGYWVPGSPSMNYKMSYSALEIYTNDAWQPIGDPKSYSDQCSAMAPKPIREQVSRIQLLEVPRPKQSQ